jgi:hypothetical protein
MRPTRSSRKASRRAGAVEEIFDLVVFKDRYHTIHSH